jgi:hypothetical protein
MSEHSPEKTDLWDKVWWLWSLILYATLLFAAVEVWFDDRYTAAQKGQMVILTVVFALWNGAFICYIHNHASDFNRERDRYFVLALARRALAQDQPGLRALAQHWPASQAAARERWRFRPCQLVGRAAARRSGA